MGTMHPMDPNAKCGAKTRKGTPCERRAGAGTEHLGIGRCKNHGGATPNGQLAGVVTLARLEAKAFGTPLPVNPHEALLQCVHIAAGEVQYATDRIARLEESEYLGEPVTTTERPLKWEKGAESPSEIVTETRRAPVELHRWIVARREAMDRLVSYSAVALKAGVEERLVRVAEAEGELLARAMRAFAEELGVADKPAAPAAMRRALMLVAGNAA